MRTAFKEWAIVVDALGRGEQILILRKGGISEGRDGFRLEHSQFLLFPTLFHQQRESVIAAAQERYDQIAPRLPSPEIVRVEFFAEVAHSLSAIGFKVLVDLLASARRPVRVGEVGYQFRRRAHGDSKLDIVVELEYLELLFDKLTGGWIPPTYRCMGRTSFRCR